MTIFVLSVMGVLSVVVTLLFCFAMLAAMSNPRSVRRMLSPIAIALALAGFSSAAISMFDPTTTEAADRETNVSRNRNALANVGKAGARGYEAATLNQPFDFREVDREAFLNAISEFQQLGNTPFEHIASELARVCRDYAAGKCDRNDVIAWYTKWDVAKTAYYKAHPIE